MKLNVILPISDYTRSALTTFLLYLSFYRH